MSVVALVNPSEFGWTFIPDSGFLDSEWRIAVTAVVLLLGSAALAQTHRWPLPHLALFVLCGVTATSATWFVVRSDLSCCPYMTTTLRGYPYPFHEYRDAGAPFIGSEFTWTMALVDVLAFAFALLLAAVPVRAVAGRLARTQRSTRAEASTGDE